MSQSLAKIYIHLVFSTKKRESYLQDLAVRQELHAYMAGILEHRQSHALAIGGTENHVHVLCLLSKNESLAALVAELKRSSSLWIKAKHRLPFQWQAGYGVFSVSHTVVTRVCQYIVNQVEHHRKISYQDELRELLRTQGIEWDEQYIWD